MSKYGRKLSLTFYSLLYDIQDYLDGKKKTYRTKVGSLDVLQLRGYLICPQCDKLLTGSASKGRMAGIIITIVFLPVEQDSKLKMPISYFPVN